MKTFLGLAGIAFMALAPPAAAYNAPPDGDPHGDRGSSGGSTPVPAPPVVILFGLAAGAVMMRRKAA